MSGMTDMAEKTDFLLKGSSYGTACSVQPSPARELGGTVCAIKTQLQATYVISEDMLSMGQSQESCR